jgi:hypothetical protein
MASDVKSEEERPRRRAVDARLVEATPGANGLGHWLLASPAIIFLAWWWDDIFIQVSPLPIVWLDRILGLALFVVLVLIPLGLLAHRLVTSLPRLFQHSGWDVHPLEPVRPQEMYSVRYRPVEKVRADTNRQRIWLRAAQGWVYLEIAIILIGAIVMIPLFFSAREFGF